MKVPEKLYLHPTTSGNVGASWLLFPLTDKDIKYARTDAFIDKVCEWLSQTDFCHYYNKEFINDFCKAMEE